MCAEYGCDELFAHFEDVLNCDLNAINYAEETPFIIAAREGRVNLIKFMMDKYGANRINPEAKTLDGWTAFSYAAQNGFLNTVEYLAIHVRVNVHTADRFKRTALHWAARYDNVHMIKKLLNLDLNYVQMDGEG